MKKIIILKNKTTHSVLALRAYFYSKFFLTIKKGIIVKNKLLLLLLFSYDMQKFITLLTNVLGPFCS